MGSGVREGSWRKRLSLTRIMKDGLHLGSGRREE